MVDNNLNQQLHTVAFRRDVKDRSDRLMNYFLAAYYLLGLVFAFFYDTWLIAFGVGSLCLVAYYSVKIVLPESNLYQYVLSVVLAVFMAQYIYQMHGLFEMHFTAFIGSAILITYQNWKVQIPMLLLVVLHHALFGYLQNAGLENVYFTQLNALELQTFIIHIVLAGAIFFICGLWGYQLKKYNEIQILQTVEMGKLQKEALLSIARKQNEEALQVTNDELRKSNQELDKFVYSVSHDLRAPLTSMLGLIEISEDGVEDPFMMKNLGLIKVSINKLDGFIADILNYSRNSRLEVVMEEIDFREMIEEIIVHHKYMNRDRRKVEIKIDITNKAPFVSDRHRITVIMNNIISNAIRYQNPGAAVPFINIKIVTTTQETSIAIQDNGIGIKKELQCKVFDMFYRVSQNSEGSGLGLYIVKQTIEKLDGQVAIDSVLGRGTTFQINLPNSAIKNFKKEINRKQVCTTG
ncbi:MAG: arcB 3 [Segetibacter sp.]|nr:arcB 3 [Segetibacter sp.]